MFHPLRPKPAMPTRNGGSEAPAGGSALFSASRIMVNSSPKAGPGGKPQRPGLTHLIRDGVAHMSRLGPIASLTGAVTRSSSARSSGERLISAAAALRAT